MLNKKCRSEEENIETGLNNGTANLTYQTVIAALIILTTALLLRFVTILPHEFFHYIPAKLAGLDPIIEFYWKDHTLHGATVMWGKKSLTEEIIITIGGGLGVFSILLPLSLALKGHISHFMVIGMQVEALRQLFYGIDEVLLDFIITIDQFYMIDTASAYLAAFFVLSYYITRSDWFNKRMRENARSKRFGYERIEKISTKFKSIFYKDRVTN